jgi:AMP-activated protein kinase-like protein
MSTIDLRLHAALDGEADTRGLPVDLRETYARMIAVAELLETTPQLSVAARVMEEIRQLPVPAALQNVGPVRRAIRWLSRPQPVTVHLRPVWTLALAAGLAAILLLPAQPNSTVTPGAREGVAHFVGHFPGAHSVEVVGSFNNWTRGVLPLNDKDHDGVWHGTAVLPAGQHEYMFVVDGERWVADPLAGRYVDDGFGAGQQNSLLIVRPSDGEP